MADAATLAVLGLGGGAAVVVATQKKPEDKAAEGSGTAGAAVGASIEQTRANLRTLYGTKAANSSRLTQHMRASATQTTKTWDGYYQKPADAAADPLQQGAKESTTDHAAEKQLADKLEAEIKKKLDSLGDKAKAEGAKFLNEQFGTNIPPDASWDDIKKQLVPALSGAAAGAGCSALATPATGPICSALGAALGAYLQEEIGPYLEKAWQDVEDWVKGAIDDIGLDDAYEWAEGAINDFGGWVEDTF